MMNKNFDYSEYVNAYLDGNMSEAEKVDFLNQLKKDPILEGEYNLQNDIVNALKDHRVAELKSRLNTIKVGNPAGFSGMKIAASVLVASLVTVGAYYYWTEDLLINENKTVVTQSLSTEALPEEIVEKVNVTPIASNSEEINSSTKLIIKEPAEKVAVKSKREVKITEKSTSSPLNKPTVSASDKSFKTPSFEKPAVITAFEETELIIGDNNNVPKSLDFSETNSKVSSVEIETKNELKYDFHYQFQNNKLYLYGDFDDMPYEIIDLQRNKGNSLFLYYKQQYYKIKQTKSRILPLEPISDQKILKELKIIKDHKGL